MRDTYPVPDLRRYLAGEWSIEREIVDSTGTRIGSLTGAATFAGDGDVLTYHERGEIELGAHRGPAHRTLRYLVTGPGTAAVHFDHGGYFHDVDLRAGHCDTSHPCRDDLYRGEYLVLGHDRWRQVWVVSGPAKSHTITTYYQRRG